MKTKKRLESFFKTIIILAIFVIIFIVAIIFVRSSINKINNQKYLNSNPLGPAANEITDNEIIKLINIPDETFKEFKDNFIGTNVNIEQDENGTTPFLPFEPSKSEKLQFKTQAENNFKLLKNYILNRDDYIYIFLLNNIQESNFNENELDSLYASVCSGMVKNYLNFDKYTIKFDKIEQYADSKEMMFSVNDKFLVLFTYSKDCFWINIYNGTKYNSDQDSIIQEMLNGYNELLYWHKIKTMPSVDKPIIYLYPTEETEISVKLLNPEKITCSYPKYTTGWNVLAKPNGDLIDLGTRRQLYSLYYESECVEGFDISKEGFIIEGKDSAKFLEEKLAILGLTEREAEEFIIYWLPKLESNKYNYIRFATPEEINNNMPLEITPTPDTLIRVLMIFKGLENPLEVEEQKLVTPERIGFTAVEWGGTEIK